MAKKRDAEALTWSELKILLKYTKHMSPKAYNYFALVSHIGIRSAEYMQVVKTWNETKSTIFYIDTKKREDRRQINMPMQLFKDDVEFPELDERQQRYLCAKWIKKLVKDGLIKERLLSPHDLRATFITALINRGVGLVQLQSVTKHKNLDNLILYYKRNPKKITTCYKLLELEEWDTEGNVVLLEKELWKVRQENLELKEALKKRSKVDGIDTYCKSCDKETDAIIAEAAQIEQIKAVTSAEELRALQKYLQMMED